MMYNEHPEYKKDETWRRISVHDEKNICGFFGPYRWLSNFEPATVEYEGLVYPSVENAYQAAKLVPEDRLNLVECTAAQSKKAWKKHKLIDTSPYMWDSRKYGVMKNLCEKKFEHPHLRTLLMDTENKYLEELNWWGDIYWGVDSKSGQGENRLGKILMLIRMQMNLSP